MKSWRVLFLLIAGLTAALPARGQINVQLTMPRHIYLRHEPVIATVTLTNNSGHDIALADTPELQWFGFQINGEGESIVPPRNPDYGLASVALRSGETVKKSVNLNELYALGDPGSFKVRATIHLAETKRYFTSRPLQIDITEGRVVGRQTAGVPEGNANAGDTHVFTLLTHYQEEKRILYARVEDRDASRILGTYPLGRLIDGAPVQAELDSANNLHVLHLIGQRAWVLSKIGVNGEFLGQTNYAAPKTRPTLRKLADGRLQIIGGQKESAVAQRAAPLEPPTKLSDRPAGLPR